MASGMLEEVGGTIMLEESQGHEGTARRGDRIHEVIVHLAARRPVVEGVVSLVLLGCHGKGRTVTGRG